VGGQSIKAFSRKTRRGGKTTTNNFEQKIQRKKVESARTKNSWLQGGEDLDEKRRGVGGGLLLQTGGETSTPQSIVVHTTGKGEEALLQKVKAGGGQQEKGRIEY